MLLQTKLCTITASCHVGDAASTSHPPSRFHQQWPALVAALILVVCCSQQSALGATINVTSTQQANSHGQCSLQEAIYASEFRASTAIGSTNPDVTYTTGCTPGDGDDIIVLRPGALYVFDHFWDGDGHNIWSTATPIIVSRIVIEGNGATLQSVDGFLPNNSRLFAIGTVNDPGFPSGTGDLTLRNVYIKGFHVRGGDGATGGGGGLGAGGAIYNEGSLTVENSTFENNGAVGGNGSPDGKGGGGGGLSGNGGTAHCGAGGGGGSRDDGGSGNFSAGCSHLGGGGGGGGTISSGQDGRGETGGHASGGLGGARCAGDGGDAAGPFSVILGPAPANCAGGGGGGSGYCTFFQNCVAEGGRGNFGGGGGGGKGDGGDGGFGGGGGSGRKAHFRVNGGNGGFGGGGGAAGIPGGAISERPGNGGSFGGKADDHNGGGGGALGGAIFNRTGTAIVRNSTFFNNFVTRGERGGGSAANGADAGGAIFSMGRSLDVNDSTFSGNQSTGSGAGIVLFVDPSNGSPSVDFALNNTIIANNGANECFFTGNVTARGVGNLIMQNGSGTGSFKNCPGVVTSSDPLLQPLALNSPGNTPTMAIDPSSPAAGQAVALTSLRTDQRGVLRTLGGSPDIGAFEATLGRCADATAFLVRANAIAGIDAKHTAAYNDLICGLSQDDGIYSKLDVLYILATQSDGGEVGDGVAKLNLINGSFNLIGDGTYAFSADKGAVCDGSSGYYDTQFNLSTSGAAFSRDSASLGVYDRSSTTTDGSVFGVIDGTTWTTLNLSFSGELYSRVNSTADPALASTGLAQGFWIETRTTASAVSVYKNGSMIASSTTPSNGVPPFSMYLCATNFNGAANDFVPDNVAAFFIGGGLTASEASAVSSRINAFMTTVGASVY